MKTKGDTGLKELEAVAQSAGIHKKYITKYGDYAAKVSLSFLDTRTKNKKPNYILVSSMTPSYLGDGTTVTAIGLSMALRSLKKKAIACLLEPSLCGIFGMKGCGTGGGASQVIPKDSINLNFTGDAQAVQSAHNLCAAFLDNSIYNDNKLDIDLDNISWPRVTDACDRFLRNVNIGLGSKADGVSRKTNFESTSASELMSIISLARNPKDLRERVGRMILAFTTKGKPVTCEEIGAAGPVSAILKDTLKPNLVQTTEHTPCFMHAADTASFGIGSSSIISDLMAHKTADYIITEAAFGTDLGAEKFFDIKCRASGLKPNAVVLVCSIRSLKLQSGDYETRSTRLTRELARENVSAVERGLSNLEKHIENIKVFGVPVIVCVNRFSENSEKEINAVTRRVKDLGATSFAVSEVFKEGSRGGIELARQVMDACKMKNEFRFLYPLDLPLKDKIRRLARTVYGAKEVIFSEDANKKMLLLKKLKLDEMPISVAKTPFSLSYNPKRRGRPHGFKFPVEDIRVNAGAGFITIFITGLKSMPGLPTVPRGIKIDLNEDGKITGL